MANEYTSEKLVLFAIFTPKIPQSVEIWQSSDKKISLHYTVVWDTVYYRAISKLGSTYTKSSASWLSQAQESGDTERRDYSAAL